MKKIILIIMAVVTMLGNECCSESRTSRGFLELFEDED